jgi:N-acetylneuraminic acid mutarotase
MIEGMIDLEMAVMGGKVYAFHRSGHSLPYSSPQSYDPATNTWETLAEVPKPTGITWENPSLGQLTGYSIAVYNDNLYLSGGRDSTCGYSCGYSYSKQMLKYDPASNAWSEMSAAYDLPTDRINPGVVIIGSKMYLFGGRVLQKASPDTLHILESRYFDFSDQSWHNIKSIPTGLGTQKYGLYHLWFLTQQPAS